MMFCPTCQTVVWSAPDICPTCGGMMREVAAGDSVEVVEGSAELGVGEPAKDDATSSEMSALAVAGSSGRVTLPAPVRLAEVSVAAWRQPAVRAAIKTGASALALTLAMRAARHMLARPPARRAAIRTVLPTLSDLLQSEAPDGRERGTMVIETFVYVRRVIRR
ncbi:MAG TPA: hypothetical protein VKQ30_15880 [Ktedonobacterales bacterium]|nr:hypothetical protein [Ktedonobacterales bacterium]